MRSLIWGAGAIGGTLGAYLARAGDDVTMVDTAVEHVDAITRGGLRVTGPIDEFTVRVPAFTPQTLSGTWDGIILARRRITPASPSARCSRTSPQADTWCRHRTG
jgi:2-dehydropantoate 2-reductase